MVEINVEQKNRTNDNWIEIKGSDVVVKIIDSKETLSQKIIQDKLKATKLVKKNTNHDNDKDNSDDDTDDENENNNHNNKEEKNPFADENDEDDLDDDDDESIGKEEQEVPFVKVNDTVLFNITARQCTTSTTYQDVTFDGPIVLQGKSWVVTISDDGTNSNDDNNDSGVVLLHKAVQLGLLQMKPGQTAYIYSSPTYAFGANTIRKYKQPTQTSKDDQQNVYTLPPDSYVLYYIELIQIVVDTSRLNPYFTIQKSTTKKLIANDIYTNEYVSLSSREHSIKIYESIINDMEKLLNGTYFNSVEHDHPQRKQCKSLLIDSYNNIVAVCISLKQYRKARDNCLLILNQYDANNIKAALRYVKCCLLEINDNSNNKDHYTIKDCEIAIQRADNIITYKNPNEEVELKKYKQQLQRIIKKRNDIMQQQQQQEST